MDGRMASPTRWTWVWASSRVGDGQGSLVCWGSWGCKELDTTERLNWTELKIYFISLMILSHILLYKYFPTLLKFSKHIYLKIAKQEMKERWWGSKMWVDFKPANINVTLEFFRSANSLILPQTHVKHNDPCFNKVSKVIPLEAKFQFSSIT